MSPTKTIALALFISLLLLASCGTGAVASTTATSAAATPLTKTQDGLNVTLDYSPKPLRVGVPTHLTLTIKDAQHQPVSDATVQVNLGMLGMNMEKNEPKVETDGNGVYATTATFSMGGNTWVVDVDIERASKTTRVSFSGLIVNE